MSLAAAVEVATGLPRFLGVRFDAAGQPLRCSGNTIVAHVAPVARAPLVALQERLAATEAGPCFAWLPPSSLHMTVFDGLLHDRRGPGYWPAGLEPTADTAQADAFMLARLPAVPPPPTSLHATITGAEGLDGGGLGLSVTPRAELLLRAYRDACAAAVGLQSRPGHDSYRFHITLAYQISWPDAAAAASFDAALAEGLAVLMAQADVDLGPAEVCLFNDMTHFAPQG